MKKLLLTAVCFFTAFASFAQINFEQGHIIDNNGNRSSVLIRNVDWRNNPSIIEYKTSEASEVKTASVSELQEFWIGDNVKYVRHTVRMDQSSDNLNNLSRSRNPEFNEETLFLEVLIEGQTDLFQFRDESRNRFLFSVNDGPVEQLVHKQYQSGTGTQRGRNNQFRQQLLNNLSCSEIGLSDVEGLNYSEKALRSFFKDYHECVGAEYVEYGAATTSASGDFNVKIKGGINLHTVELERVGSLHTIENVIEIEADPSPAIGVELEYALPFNKQKWSVFSGISYYQIKGEQEYQHISYDPSRSTTFKLDYSVLSIPLGIRHYFYLSDNSAIFANGGYEFSSYVSGSIVDSENAFENEIGLGNVAHTLQFGVGYSWKKKIGAEVKYSMSQDYLAEHGDSSSNLSKWEGRSSYISLMLSYTIF